jgi:hypothetical protein
MNALSIKSVEFIAEADALVTNTCHVSIAGFITHLGLCKEDSYKLIKKAVHLAKQTQSIHPHMEEKKPSEGDVLCV